METCPYKKVLGCDCQFPTRENFVSGTHDCRGFEEPMAYKCPHCNNGILNPTFNITMACDKCGFDEPFGYFDDKPEYKAVSDFGKTLKRELSMKKCKKCGSDNWDFIYDGDYIYIQCLDCTNMAGLNTTTIKAEIREEDAVAEVWNRMNGSLLDVVKDCVFYSPYDQYKEHNGKKCILISEVTENKDEEVVDSYLIQFEDGTQIEALPEELVDESGHYVYCKVCGEVNCKECSLSKTVILKMV